MVDEDIGNVLITVIRVKGDDESHALKWKTSDITAIHDNDYTGGEHLVNMAKVSKSSKYVLGKISCNIIKWSPY